MSGSPPAFPQGQQHGGGLTRREWFAGQALAGLTVNPPPGATISDTVRDAFDYADAMMEARDR